MEDIKTLFSKIYDDHIEQIYRFIFLKVGKKEIAEDLSSETFLKTFEFFQKSNKGFENPRAFLYQVARNLVIDYYRKNRNNQIISTEDVTLIDPVNLEEKIQKNSDLENIRLTLSTMKKDYQDIIIMRHIEGFSIPEISSVIKKSEGATRGMLFRALSELKDKMRNA